MQNEPAIAPPNLLALPRDGLVQANIIHDFVRERVVANLGGCYGWLIRARYRSLLGWVAGRRIIDCGCGFGLFSRVALDAGYIVVAVDIDDVSLDIAQNVTAVPCRKESVYATSLPDQSCDTAVCCDSIQHFELDHFIPEMHRLGVRRIIVYDSNIHNPVLKMYRHINGHKESNDRTPGEIAAAFRRYRFEVTHMQYENIVSLPLSGGLQRAPVPGLTRFPGVISRVDGALSAVAFRLRIERWLSFRFCMVLSIRDAPSKRAGSR
jgi:SAM-dependent methyltransferase